MNRIVLSALVFGLAMQAVAGPFDQLYEIEQQTKQAEAKAETERLRAQAAERARLEARQQAERKEREANLAAARKHAAAQLAAKDAEQRRVNTREEAFEDELRALELEERKLALQAKRARVARTDDYIDAELKREAATTDVIQSEADATRNVTEGTKSLLQDAGKAEVNRSSRLFGD